MKSKFRTVALIGRQKSVVAAKTLRSVINFLSNQKINLIIEKDTATILPNCQLPIFSRNELKDHCQLIIVVGGDGSLLNAAHIAAPSNIPVLGVNRGYLGFLTDILPTNLSKIKEILAGDFYEEQRFLLNVKMQYHNKIIAKSLALNDIVLLSSLNAHIIEFAVHVDGQFVCNYYSDGLIISTPTGSTAHALSGGGPILYPSLEAIVLVPMFSHNLSSRPIVIKSDHDITIEYYEKNSNDMRVSCDGQERIAIPPGGTISISKYHKTLRLLHPLDYNYFETLRTKLNWEREGTGSGIRKG